ncbi:MAG: phasin family protein [Halioglobus sp.]|nr:phasin family protein [Halioglobus sp.]
MSDDKSKVTDKASEIAKNIWLAGVGAYGKAVEDAQGRLEKAMEPPKLFKDLVKAGSALEEDAREALETTAAARHSVEERINKVRENFHMQRPARIEDLQALHKKVDKLSKQVAALTKALEQQGLAVKPTRSASSAAKKKPSGSRGRTAGRKAAAKKATPKAAAAGKKAPARRKTPAAKKK